MKKQNAPVKLKTGNKEELMPGCEKNCGRENMYRLFAEQMEKVSVRTIAQQALEKLEEYVTGAGLDLCGLGKSGMCEFVLRLNGLEQEGVSLQTVSHWISIISLFFDFLESRGCVHENPVRVLKQQEMERLLKKIEEHGYRRQKLEVPDEEE